MQEYLARHYYSAFFLLLAAIATGSFYAGYLEGKGSGSEAVVLACTDSTLSSLAIPLTTLSSKSVKQGGESDTGIGATAADSVGPTVSSTAQGKYVGSKNGTKYYSPSCGTVKRIKPENYIWFQDVQEAQLQGYTQGKC